MNFSVIVLSIDKNEELSKELMAKNYQNLSSLNIDKFILISESFYFLEDGKKRYLNTKLISFCARIEFASRMVKTKYVLLLLDDFYIKCSFDFNEVKNIIALYNPDYLRLNNNPANGYGIVNSNFVLTNIHHTYRLNTQPSLWKNDKLLLIASVSIGDKLLDSPWGLELYWGIKYNYLLDLTLSSRKNYLISYELIKKGKLLKRLATKLNIEVTMDSYSVLEEYSFVLKGIIGRMKRVFSSIIEKFIF